MNPGQLAGGQLAGGQLGGVPIQIAIEQRAFCIKCSNPEQLSKIKLTINLEILSRNQRAFSYFMNMLILKPFALNVAILSSIIRNSE